MFHYYLEKKNDKVLTFNIFQFPNRDLTVIIIYIYIERERDERLYRGFLAN